MAFIPTLVPLPKAVGHKDAPPEAKAALKTEDGDELQLVDDEVAGYLGVGGGLPRGFGLV
jgi:hypothetical protein